MSKHIHPDNHAKYPALSDELEHVADKLERDPTLAKKRWGDFICDIAAKARHYALSEAQVKAVAKAMRSRAEMEDVPDVGDRRVGISGEVLSLKGKMGYGGRTQLKMLVKTRMVDGRDVTCKLYGTVPGDLVDRVAEGAKVNFTASIDKSGDDPKFGFFGNPRDAEFEGDERVPLKEDDPPTTTSASGVIKEVRDTARKCGHLTYNPNGDELICIANKHDSDEPHEYMSFDAVEGLLAAANDATEATLSLTKAYEERPERVYPAQACARCGPDGMAQPEHLFDALGHGVWEYTDDGDGRAPLACQCCDELIDAWGAGPEPEDVRCAGKCSEMVF